MPSQDGGVAVGRQCDGAALLRVSDRGADQLLPLLQVPLCSRQLRRKQQGHQHQCCQQFRWMSACNHLGSLLGCGIGLGNSTRPHNMRFFTGLSPSEAILQIDQDLPPIRKDSGRDGRAFFPRLLTAGRASAETSCEPRRGRGVGDERSSATSPALSPKRKAFARSRPRSEPFSSLAGLESTSEGDL